MPKTISLSVPEAVEGTPFEKDFLEAAQRVLTEQTVLKLYRERKLSTGTGAKLLSMSIYDFTQFLSEHQVAIFDEDEHSLLAGLTAATNAVNAKPQPKKKEQ